jgi:hypothetical protein
MAYGKVRGMIGNPHLILKKIFQHFFIRINHNRVKINQFFVKDSQFYGHNLGLKAATALTHGGHQLQDRTFHAPNGCHGRK